MCIRRGELAAGRHKASDEATEQGKQEAQTRSAKTHRELTEQTGGATNCGEEICILTGRV
jgi:hypothetical protein